MLDFWAFGDPVPWPRPRVAHNGGVYVTPKATAWKNCVILFATVAKKSAPPIEGDVILELEFLLPHGYRGDWDNYEKGVADGLTKAGVWHDDKQVKKCTTILREATGTQAPGVHIVIKGVDDGRQD